jgi:TonB family protein
MSSTGITDGQPSQTDNRRLFVRRRLDRLAYVDFGPDNGGMLIDISEGGLSFQGVGPVGQGQRLRLRFTLPGLKSKPIEATVEVRWSNSSSKVGGLQFVEITEDARQRLQQWISMDGLNVTDTVRRPASVIPGPAGTVAAAADASIAQKNNADKNVAGQPVIFPPGDPPPEGVIASGEGVAASVDAVAASAENTTPAESLLAAEAPAYIAASDAPVPSGNLSDAERPPAIEAKTQDAVTASPAQTRQDAAREITRIAATLAAAAAAPVKPPDKSTGKSPVASPVTSPVSAPPIAPPSVAAPSAAGAAALPGKVSPPDVTASIYGPRTFVLGSERAAPEVAYQDTLDEADSRRSLLTRGAIILASACLVVFTVMVGVHIFGSPSAGGGNAPAGFRAASLRKDASADESGQQFQVEVVNLNNKRWLLTNGSGGNTTKPNAQPEPQPQRAENRTSATADKSVGMARHNMATTFQPLPIQQPRASQPARAASEMAEPSIGSDVAFRFTSIDSSAAGLVRPPEAPAPAAPVTPRAPTNLGFPRTGFQGPVLIDHTEPAYPALARQQHAEGDVLVRVTIGKDGVPRLSQIVRGDSRLVQSVLDVIPHWRYKPALLNGQPVESQTVVTVSFRLK